ncbi:MAG: DUF29 domain-containing protein [Planctomycetes bacterium]|nr:DUF29 domain-containing protein [Planctomycetota bacterium]
MATAQLESLTDLYEQDETAWLEAMAKLVARKQYADLDHKHLSEFLTDMAKRDRREVYSRLVTLMCHLLKWQYQPDYQTGSWRSTIRQQRIELRMLLESGTLQNHANAILADAYTDARKRATDETGLKVNKFPKACLWHVDDLLADD